MLPISPYRLKMQAVSIRRREVRDVFRISDSARKSDSATAGVNLFIEGMTKRSNKTGKAKMSDTPQTLTTMEAGFTLNDEHSAEFWKHQERMGPIAAASPGFVAVIGGPMVQHLRRVGQAMGGHRRAPS